MEMSKERREYLKQYKKERLKRIPLEVPFDFYERIKAAAKLDGMPVNRYIKAAIIRDIQEKKREIDLLRAKMSGENQEGE